ncbi:MAG: diguanylate cyclase [Deltaproteobacteria bacterium]|jgi:GGDEF domain-containing protein/CHASE3 domain sensor protein|nr:diguanylate cyclase [Deltaproteobacteria bacterium]MBW2504103.1 diguanylate cyclase [Deltaproteobacteria bacterium]MBW2520741.1 diguanylate cyclase [Deltaproteobacteria bacterium]
MNSYFSITRRVALGYLVILAFCLLAIGYALISLRAHNQRTEQLVGIQFQAFTQLRDVRQNLIAQGNLEKQIVILEDHQLLQLLQRRQNEYEGLLSDITSSPLSDYSEGLPSAMTQYLDRARQLLQAFEQKQWAHAATIANNITDPMRTQLLENLNTLRVQHQLTLDMDLHELSRQSSKAYRLTMILTLLGIILSAPVALTVIGSIHGSIRALQKATREIAAGSFETPIGIRSNDEFGQLAQDFASMARKLAELEQMRLDANPLTHLPGNLAIDRELQQRMDQKTPFAHLYIDLDNFKAYSDHYGYKAGSDVISKVGDLLRKIVDQQGNSDDLVGHIGGDDYVIMTSPAKAETLAKTIIAEFDQRVPTFYKEEDLEAGFVVGTDRDGIKRSFPLLTISIAVTLSENLEHPTLLTISRNCATMKSHLKQKRGSNYLIDRRKQLL